MTIIEQIEAAAAKMPKEALTLAIAYASGYRDGTKSERKTNGDIPSHSSDHFDILRDCQKVEEKQ